MARREAKRRFCGCKLHNTPAPRRIPLPDRKGVKLTRLECRCCGRGMTRIETR